MKKYLFLLTLSLSIGFLGYSQTVVDFSSIPKTGTIMVFAHQDDDLIWMLPFWNKCEKFILGAMPTTPAYESMIHNQQIFLDNNNYNIAYESNWVHPWDEIPQQVYSAYYLSNDQLYSYLALDHITDFWWTNGLNAQAILREINKMKAKLEPYIASASTSRIITHDNWGEYGHEHHVAINKAIRELAVKYRKDVWMLGCTVDATTGDFTDIEIPSGITYTSGTFDGTLFNGIRAIYKYPVDLWTWKNSPYVISGSHPFIKIVEAGVDKSNILRGDAVTVSGQFQAKPGAFIFDGIDDYLTLPGNNFSSFTIGMWVRPDVIQAMDISKMTEYPSAATCDRSFYMQNDGKVIARIYDGQSSKTITSQSALSTNSWSHILITGDGNSLKIYFNGVYQSEISNGAAYSQYDSPEFVIGQAQETASFFKGQISDVRLYNYVLSQQEITSVSSVSPLVVKTITASANYGGTISPPGTVMINQGSSSIFTITPVNNYRISDVKVDNVSVGAVSSYTFSNILVNHTIAATFDPTLPPNIALNKTASCQSGAGVGDFPASKANDADGTNSSYWQAPNYPMWWEVDLGANYNIAKIVIRNYVDGRYYHYEIQGSSDDVTFTQITNKTNNNAATDAGDSYDVNITARYLKVIMNSNSANAGVHISDFRAYGTLNTSTWTGASNVDDEWFNPANWLGEVPDATKNVVIPHVGNEPVIRFSSVASAVCNNLIIDNSANLEISSTGSLTVNGTLTNNSGVSGLVIKSDASGTGSLTENSGALATIERYIANNWNWHLISSPVANQAIWPEFAPVPANLIFTAPPWLWDFYYFNPNCPSTGTSWVNLRKNSNGEYNDNTVYTSDDNAGFGTFPPKFENGSGYLAAYSGGWKTNSPETHLFSGLCNSGSISRLIINNASGSSYNLVGNPYPSSIDWDLPDGTSSWGRSGALVLSGSGYDYWVWDDVLGQYRYRNSASTLGNAGRFIEPGQGFFVQAKANPTPLIFNNGIRTHSSDKGYFKSSQNVVYTIRLKLTTEANSFSDEMFLDFNTSYSGLEGTQKFMSFYTEAPEIYSVKEGNSYSIDRYPEVRNDLTANISTKCGVAGKYTITASIVSGFVRSPDVYLEDLKTGVKINLKENDSYSFSGNPDDATDRFKLTFSEFTGVQEQEAVKEVYVYSFGKDIYINSTLPNIGKCDVFVYDVIGHIVYKDRYEPGKNNSKFATLNVIPGAYFVKVKSQTGNTTAKIIIL